MTGPGEGKLLLNGAKVYLNNEKIPAEVYIHVKGYSLARVTHLDIEHEKSNSIIEAEKGGFFTIYGIEKGIKIDFGKKFVLVIYDFLSKVLSKGEKIRAWVGGIYIGFRKEQIVKLEKIAKEKFNF
ncbi:MAG: hypothetical protein QW641_01000 [Candidatus Aenigmatarchaeota archaeon]